MNQEPKNDSFDDLAERWPSIRLATRIPRTYYLASTSVFFGSMLASTLLDGANVEAPFGLRGIIQDPWQ